MSTYIASVSNTSCYLGFNIALELCCFEIAIPELKVDIVR